MWNYHFKFKTCQSDQGAQLCQQQTISTTHSFWGCHPFFFTKYRTEFLPRSIRFTGDEGLFCATQSKWHPLTDRSFTPHNGCFSLNMYFILFCHTRIVSSVCTWKWNHFKVNQTFPKTCRKLRILQSCFILQRAESQVLLYKQTHYIFFSYISCIRILKDIIRLHLAQLWQIILMHGKFCQPKSPCKGKGLCVLL